MILRDLSLLDDRLRSIVDKILSDCKYHNMPFEVFETGRTIERQKTLVKEGFSRTMNSKHIVTYGPDGIVIVKPATAVDLVLRYQHEGQEVWSWGQIGDEDQRRRDIGLYKMMIEMVMSRYNVSRKSSWTRLVSGGQWKGFCDYPHVELG